MASHLCADVHATPAGAHDPSRLVGLGGTRCLASSLRPSLAPAVVQQSSDLVTASSTLSITSVIHLKARCRRDYAAYPAHSSRRNVDDGAQQLRPSSVLKESTYTIISCREKQREAHQRSTQTIRPQQHRSAASCVCGEAVRERRLESRRRGSLEGFTPRRKGFHGVGAGH